MEGGGGNWKGGESSKKYPNFINIGIKIEGLAATELLKFGKLRILSRRFRKKVRMLEGLIWSLFTPITSILKFI